MNKILITGATGLVGKAIVKECLNKGIAINYLTTNKTKIHSDVNYQGFLWNPIKGNIDIDAFTGVDIIINLAGASIAKRWSTNWKQELLDSRVQSLRLLYKTIGEQNVQIKQIISASAIGYYPDSLTNLYDESFSVKSEGFLTELVNSWETEAQRFTELNIKVAIIRIGLVLSNKGGVLSKMTPPIKYFVGSILGSGAQWQSWIHIDDLANLFLFVYLNKMGGIFNGVGPNPVTQKVLTKSISTALNRPIILPRTPNFVLRFILGEMSEIVLTGQRVSSKKIENLGFKFKYHTVEGALENLLV